MEDPDEYVPQYTVQEVKYLILLPYNTYISINCNDIITNGAYLAYAGDSDYNEYLYYTQFDWCASKLEPKLCEEDVNCGDVSNCIGPCYGTNPICGVNPYENKIQCVPIGGVSQPWYQNTWFIVSIFLIFFVIIIGLVIFLLLRSSKAKVKEKLFI